MNRLTTEKRVQILAMLCEGSSMRATSRVADISINTVTKLLVDAGLACARFHDEAVRGVKAQHVQCDEIWSFCYAKAKNVPAAKAAPEHAGDVWTWTALDRDSKLIVSYLVGGRDSEYALEFMDDLRDRSRPTLARPLIRGQTRGHEESAEWANNSRAAAMNLYLPRPIEGTLLSINSDAYTLALCSLC